MGGFQVQPIGQKDFPINAKQLHYLLEKGYMQLPRVSAGHIRDKNKVDGMLRLITVIQTLWFVVNFIARPIQGLTVTALELSTTAFVILGFATSLCWMSKPADVEYADIITSEKTMDEILLEGKEAAAGVYYYTPLDFVGRAEWPWSRLWNHGLQLLRRLHWPVAKPPSQRPIPRFSNTLVPVVDGWYYILFCGLGIIYLSTFLIGWNFSFPTRIESILWRSASLVALLSALIECIVMHWMCSWYPKLRAKIQRARSETTPETQDIPHRQSNNSIWGARWFHRFTAYLRNNSVMKDPALDNQPLLVIATWVFGIFYSSARAYIVVADVIELRSLPANAYKTVDWTMVIPHFQ